MDAGATCSGHFKASSEDELASKVADHLRTKHKVQNVSKTLQRFVLRTSKS